MILGAYIFCIEVLLVYFICRPEALGVFCCVQCLYDMGSLLFFLPFCFFCYVAVYEMAAICVVFAAGIKDCDKCRSLID